MNFERIHAVLPMALLLSGGALLQPLAPRGPRSSGEPGALAPLAGQGVLLAVLGGFRAPVADGLWLKANLAWERRDLVGTDALVRAAIAADDRVEYFRLNGARMIAFDLADWRIPPDAPAAVAAGIRREQAESALALLAEGELRRGPSAVCLIEMARIAQMRLGDHARAAELYRQAAEVPGAPYFAGRLHVDLLVRAGRIRAARDWLRDWLPALPADDGAAQRQRMQAKLEELDQLLAREHGGGGGGGID